MREIWKSFKNKLNWVVFIEVLSYYLPKVSCILNKRLGHVHLELLKGVFVGCI